VRGFGILIANSVPPHPHPLPNGEREKIGVRHEDETIFSLLASREKA